MGSKKGGFRRGEFSTIVLNPSKIYFSAAKIKERSMQKKKALFWAACLFTISFFVSSCHKDSGTEPDTGSTGTTTTTTTTTTGETVAAYLAKNCTSHEGSGDYTYNTSSVIPIAFSGTTITASGTGVSVYENKVTITAGGTYSLSGTLTNGQVVVTSTDTAAVKLILNGVNITNTTSAPIYITNASKAVIVLADNTTNYLTDASTYVYASADEDEPNAALFSKADLSIYGNGSLTVKGNYNDGIASKDGLIIKSGNINVTAADDGIRGKDYLIVKGGTLTVKSKGDGLKADNDADSTKGYIYIATGTLNITATAGDAITAETDVLISDGQITLTSGGGSSYTATSTTSTKGIKGIVNTIIDGGTFTISSSDDALHSNKNLVINAGTFAISSGDDGIHADATLKIYGGTINITKCYEGIESAALTINSGNIYVVASDDGINGAGGNDGSSTGSFVTTGNYTLHINGGYIVVNAAGDGIDVNGAITMTGGTVIVNGPTNSGNGALDYDTTFIISGGSIVATGSSGMSMAPSTSSTINSVLINFRSSYSANTLMHIQSSSGTEILTCKPVKTYQSLEFSSSKLVTGTTYDVYYGGTSTGTLTDGVYSGGTYLGGTKYTSFTVSGTVTKMQN
jgi:hypothetical protein